MQKIGDKNNFLARKLRRKLRDVEAELSYLLSISPFHTES